MYYEINVSLNGKHLFATHKRSVTSGSKLKEVYNIFKDKFSKEDGFEITVTYYEEKGYKVNMESEVV